MEANKILEADVLDIIFEGRNKEYGAYLLRKTYNRRMFTAFTCMMALCGIFVAGYALAEKVDTVKTVVMIVADPHLEDVTDKPVIPPPVTPPPPKPVQVQIETRRFTPFDIVPDERVKDTDAPPENKDLEDVKIGTFDRDGIKSDDIIAPPVNDGRGVMDAPKNVHAEDDITFRKVEIESQYSGGAGAWMRYLNKTFRYPEDALNSGLQGTVTVQFIVDQEGNVSKVEAVEGPLNGGLREEAIRVIAKSGKWEPAIQNGR